MRHTNATVLSVRGQKALAGATWHQQQNDIQKGKVRAFPFSRESFVSGLFKSFKQSRGQVAFRKAWNNDDDILARHIFPLANLNGGCQRGTG